MGWTVRCGVVVLAFAAAAACSNGGDGRKSAVHASADASTVPATKPAPTTTISVPLYSFDNSVPPPKLIQTGRDYKAILQSLLDYVNWLAAHDPDPALVRKIAAPGSQAERGYTHDAAAVHHAGTRAYELRSGPNKIDVVATKLDLFTARVTESIELSRFVRSDGFITSETRPGRRQYVYVVVRVNGHWYLFDGGEQGRTNVRP